MARMLTDPPELAQYADRGDPPIEKWPGRPVTREDVMAATGDPRDWFRYGHRLQAFEESWLEFADGRARRRDLTSGFEFNQILLIGEFGLGKTTIASKKALEYFRRGHAVFSNASALFGWRLERAQMYTAMGFIPKASFMMIDESSAALSNLMGTSVAVDSFVQMNLNTRKQACTVIYMSAMDWAISSGIRRECKEVWMPVDKENLVVDDDEDELPGRSRRDPARDPANFRLAYHVWDDYPYKKKNLIEGPDPTAQEGFGPPAYTAYDEGELVRRAFLLNDTFQLAQAGAARMAGAGNVKEDLLRFHGGAGPSSNGNGDDRKYQIWERMVMFFEERRAEEPAYFQSGEIASALGIDSSTAGRLLKELIPGIKPKQRHGYPAEPIYEAIGA